VPLLDRTVTNRLWLFCETHLENKPVQLYTHIYKLSDWESGLKLSSVLTSYKKMILGITGAKLVKNKNCFLHSLFSHTHSALEINFWITNMLNLSHLHCWCKVISVLFHSASVALSLTILCSLHLHQNPLQPLHFEVYDSLTVLLLMIPTQDYVCQLGPQWVNASFHQDDLYVTWIMLHNQQMPAKTFCLLGWWTLF
jgi:hypothetical protein